jgi:parvulin-like peptidyl-prolyl isomerase
MNPKFNRLQRCVGNTAILLSLSCVLFFPLAAAKSAEKPGDTSASALKDRVVAEVANEALSLSYLNGYLALRPQLSDAGTVTDVLESRLQELIVSEILYQEALRRQMHLEPNTRWRIQQMLAQRLLEEQVSRPVRERKISDQELRAYYDEQIHEFRRPAQVRVADIFIAVDPAADSGQRKQKKQKAEKVLAEVLARQDERLGFVRRMQQYSDAPGKYSKGNTGFFDIQGKPIGLDPNLAREAFKLKETGQVCEQVIEAADGYHIIMLAGKREPFNRPFDKVKEHLRQRMYRHRVELAQTEYIESLKQRCEVRINQDVFDELVKERQAKAKTLDVETKGAFPTFGYDANLPARLPRGPR